MSQKKIVDAREDQDGNISHVLLEGNTNYTSKDKAIKMTEQGQIEGTHVVNKSDGTKYLRTNPDGKKSNNLDEMAKD